MSTRKDGLSLATVDRTIRHVLATYGVEVCGGNHRVLHLRRLDGNPDVGAATSYGFTLARTLSVHGFTLLQRAGAVVIDLLECAETTTSAELAELVAARDEAEARVEWIEARDRGEEPPGRSAGERGIEVASETYRWALTQTAARLQRWLAAP